MLTIREAAPGEIPAAVDLLTRAFELISWFRRADALFGPVNGRPWQERLRARIEKAPQGQTVLLGFEGDALRACAVCGYDPKLGVGFLDLLGVEPAAHGQGHGRRMLRAFEDWARAQGAAAVNLDCLVDNDVGNALYASEGYHELARQIRWFKPLAPAE